MKKILSYKSIALLVAALGLVIMLSGCSTHQSVDLSDVVFEVGGQNADISNTISVRGVVESTNSRTVFASLGTDIESIEVRVGDSVTAGQVLAVLDTQDIEDAIVLHSEALRQARQNIHTVNFETWHTLNRGPGSFSTGTNQRLSRAQNELTIAERNLTDARRDFNIIVERREAGDETNLLGALDIMERARVELSDLENRHERLVLLNQIGEATAEQLRRSEVAIESAEVRLSSATATYESLMRIRGPFVEEANNMLEEAIEIRNNALFSLYEERIEALKEVESPNNLLGLTLAMSEIEYMEITLEQLQRQLDRGTVSAPISGTVTAIYAEVGAMGAGLLFTVEDTESLRIITSLREYDINRISEGMEVSITVDGTAGAVFGGVISRISPTPIPYSLVTEFEVEVQITSSISGLRSGMTARVEIVLDYPIVLEE